MLPVITAARSDRERLVGMVVAAFHDDPAWMHICGGEYERVAPLFAGALFDARVEAGTIWMTADGAAVAMWDGPDIPSSRDGLWASFQREAGEEIWARLNSYDAALRMHRPAEPHWYLGVLASDPARRREGLGGAVMRPAMAIADDAGLTACLETSTLENRAFYAKRGFTESAEVDLGPGPATWWLTRQPAGQRGQRL